MKKTLLVLTLPILLLPAWAQSEPAATVPASTVSAATVPAVTPLLVKWQKAQAVLDAATADFRVLGFAGLQGHVADMEQVLAQADTATDGTSRNGDIYKLADGAQESSLAQSIGEVIRSQHSHGYGRVVIIDNPYPALALLLGSYYDNLSRHEDALRVFDLGLNLASVKEMRMGVHVPSLIAARCVAMAHMKRLPQALAACDDGLTLMLLSDRDKARLHRGRGLVLIQMGRLDEADAAYRDALKLEPDSAAAKQQLEAIAKLRSAAPKAPN